MLWQTVHKQRFICHAHTSTKELIFTPGAHRSKLILTTRREKKHAEMHMQTAAEHDAQGHTVVDA
jgi:hypothetical protein